MFPQHTNMGDFTNADNYVFSHTNRATRGNETSFPTQRKTERINTTSLFDIDHLTKAECSHLMAIWRICWRCETSIIQHDDSSRAKMFLLGCGCVDHDSGDPLFMNRRIHPRDCLNLQREVLRNYVKKTWGTEDVREAYRTYIERTCPLLLPKQNTMLEEEYRRLKEELTRQQMLKVENERDTIAREKNKTQEELEATSGKLAKLGNELREMKRKWMEVRATDRIESKEKAGVESDDRASDECMMKFEIDSFQLLFNELQKKIADLGRKSFSIRNNKLRKELTQKIAPVTEISCDVEERVVNTLKMEGDRVQTALEGLLDLENDFPSTSTRRENDYGDAKLLD